MYYKFPCTHCGKNLKAREEHAGRKVGCPYCKAAVLVPAPPEPELDPLASLDPFAPPSSGAPAAKGKANVQSQSARKPAPSKAASGGGKRTDGTNVSMVSSGLIGLVLTVVFYAAILPIHNLYLPQLFIHRGWVPYVETYFMFWAVTVLVMKQRKLNRQRASMLFDLLPTEIAEEITLASAPQFTAHIRDLPGEPGESFLINRVLRGLEHFQVRKNAPEVANILASQSEMDAGSAYSSYTMVKVFIWAIPILGFIGTVIGISLAVGSFSGSLGGDIDALKKSLGGVTSGLATAFDTTLLALVMSMFLKFPTSSMQKAEEDLIGSVDEYCNENLLKRLNDGRDGGAERGSGGGRSAIQSAVDGAMREHHAELRAWTKKLETIGETLSGQVSDRWGEASDAMAERWERLHAEMGEKWSQASAETTGHWDQINARMLEQMQAQYGDRVEQAEALSGMVRDFQQTIDNVQLGLQSLNEVLAALGERQIQIEIAPAAEPARRGWFFSRSKHVSKNGRT